MATGTVIGAERVAQRPLKASFYRPELDVLRFFAFFGIYLFHSLPLDPSVYSRYRLPHRLGEFIAAFANSGRWGVTLFFLLSGYLITSLLLRERWMRGDVNLRSFYLRRILRIWPLYFFVLLVAVVWPRTGHLPGSYFLAYLLLAGNWITAISGPPDSWASVLWTIALVQQFYVFWPLVIKFFSRNARFYTAVGLVVVAILVRGYLAVGSLLPYTVYPDTFAELDSIGAGILCAIALKASVPILPAGKRLLLVYSGVVLLLGCGYLAKTESPLFVMGAYPCATAGCLALFLAICGTSFTTRPLVYLGKISYGLYVFHLLALRLVGSALGGKAGTPIRFLIYWGGSLLLTIALASASYRWLEAPFLRLKTKFTTVTSRPL
jgi:peptidoglycan/LPS O-acetylase OafA/YrhL